ncbi:MAG TPA: hypothetical protein VKY85_15705 [Candidatus Angelobacter sp.]|nr:hypothetical protein [Candidatus Angelobacter sp.]
MKTSAIGVRVHSGWGALVVVSGKPGVEEIVERRRVVITDAKMAGAIQPYHFGKTLQINQGEQHVARCAAASARLALSALRELLQELHRREYRVAGSCILLSSGRPLPDFARILASHALIHTAEGEFFRKAFRDAFEQLEIPVTGIRERDLQQQAQSKFGKGALKLEQRIAGMGRSLGPPWTTDQKNAALAAFLVLH